MKIKIKDRYTYKISKNKPKIKIITNHINLKRICPTMHLPKISKINDKSFRLNQQLKMIKT